MTSRTTRPPGSDTRRRTAFTLIELILVLALMVVLASIVAPRMAGFFQGRVLDNEVRRFLSLVRYAQSRAVTEGVPVLVWMDEENRRYGLQVQAGFLEKDDKAVEYTLADDIELEVGQPLTTAQTLAEQRLTGTLPTHWRAIRFSPDGFLGDQSPEAIRLRRNADIVVAMGPTRTWQSYEIVTNLNIAQR
jgi:type II secretion system protein H